MSKRAVTIFFILNLMFGMTFLRLFLLIETGHAESGITSNSMSLEIDESRGYIYDCNMSPLVNEGIKKIAVISPDASVLP